MAMNVLLSNPSSRPDVTILPYIYGLLKTHCARDERLARDVEWMDPIYRLDDPDTLLEGYDLGAVDVLGLTAYTWNWLAQREVARRVKEANPGCLVVAGGPHCDYDDPDFFRRNPFLDIVVEKEGEEPFRKILLEKLNGSEEWEGITGLYLPDEEGVPRSTGPPDLLEEEEILSVSPYEAQSDVFKEIIDRAKYRGEHISGPIETNRGCPYRCTFCDWGSLTYTKVRKFGEERVKRDIDFLAKNEVTSCGFTDANVGMFERDVDFVRYLCECSERYGFPKEFGYNPTKTKAKYLPEITRTLHEHGLQRRSILAVQHTVPEVLDAIERKNLTREELLGLVEFNREHDIPMQVQLILGCPNDTYDRWKQCLTDLMEWGIDDQYTIGSFQLLPNAPAADEEYMEEWDIEFVTTPNIAQAVLEDSTPVPSLAKKRIVTSTSTFDEDEWTRMWVYSHLVRSFHGMGLTHRVAVYLRYCEGVLFRDFYEGFVDGFAREQASLQNWVERMTREKREGLREGREVEKTRLELLSESSFEPQFEEWLFVHTVLNRDEIYRDMKDWILEEFSVDVGRLGDLLRYQRKILVTPDYDPRLGKSFEGEYDWPEYFGRDRDDLTTPPLERPRRFVIEDRKLGRENQQDIRWHHHEGDERLETWIDDAVRNRPFLPTVILRGRAVTLHDVESQAPAGLLRRLREAVEGSLRQRMSGA